MTENCYWTHHGDVKRPWFSVRRLERRWCETKGEWGEWRDEDGRWIEPQETDRFWFLETAQAISELRNGYPSYRALLESRGANLLTGYDYE